MSPWPIDRSTVISDTTDSSLSHEGQNVALRLSVTSSMRGTVTNDVYGRGVAP